MKGLPRMGIRELRRDIGRKVDEAHYLKQAVLITKNGSNWAFLGPTEWLAELAAYRAKYGPLEPTEADDEPRGV